MIIDTLPVLSREQFLEQDNIQILNLAFGSIVNQLNSDPSDLEKLLPLCDNPRLKLEPEFNDNVWQLMLWTTVIVMGKRGKYYGMPLEDCDGCFLRKCGVTLHPKRVNLPIVNSIVRSIIKYELSGLAGWES